MKTARQPSVRLLALGILLGPVCCLAQNTTPATPSLGDLARQECAERARQALRPTRTYTNDDFPPSASLGPHPQVSTSESSKEPSENSEQITTDGNEKSARDDDQNYYRTTMRRLKNQLAADQKTLKYWGERPERDSAGRVSFYNVHQYELSQAEVAADENAISELEESCRRTGCFPEWIR